MSVFSSTLSWFKKTFSTFFANQNGTTLVAEAHSAQVAINVLTPGLVLALQEAGASEGSAEVSQVAAETVTDLGTVSTLLSQIQAGQGNAVLLVSSLNGIKANLSGLLAAGHIKNPQTVTTVTNVTNAFISEIEVIVNEFQSAQQVAA